MITSLVAVLATGLALVAVPAPLFAQCASWQPGMQPPGLGLRTNGTQSFANALKAHDDGSGSKLYVGGRFQGAGRRLLSNLASWNGLDWEPVGSAGPNLDVWDLEEFDDGSGLALYAAGAFSQVGGVPASRVARWDGSVWSSVGGGVNGEVRALEVFDDGTGPALYAAGVFTSAGGQPASGIARWNGTAWAPLGSGLVYVNAYALAVFDDGNGPALYVGGSFHHAGGVPVANVARWRAGAWSAVGSGWVPPVRSLCVHDDGSGPALYCGAREGWEVRRFQSSAWSVVGGTFNSQVGALFSFDDGNGSRLYAAGDFNGVGGVPIRRLARWDGSAWSQVAAGLDTETFAFGTFDDRLGGGPALYVGAGSYAQGASAGISRWTGSQLVPLGSGSPLYSTQGTTIVSSMAVFDDGTGHGEELYVGGWFDQVGSLAVPGMARWDGWRWRPVPGAAGRNFRTLAVLDDGAGPALYGWADPSYQGSPYNGLGRWTGAAWVPVGPSWIAGVSGDQVLDLEAFDDGTGVAIYALGRFASAGAVPAANVARFANGSWAPLGGGLTGEFPRGSALAAFDDGTGPALFVAGDFLFAGGLVANSIARWQNGTWSTLGSGLQRANQSRGAGWALAVWDDGTGPGLYVAGDFALAGGVVAENIACWKNGAFSPVGAGISTGCGALLPHDDGTGSVLVAAGGLTSAGGSIVRGIATWDGTTWATLGTGLQWGASRLAAYGSGLYAVGSMYDAGGRSALLMARWEALPYRDCNGNGSDDACDLAHGTSADVDQDGVPDDCQPVGAETVCAGDGSSRACPCGDMSAYGRGCANSQFPQGALLEALGAADVGNDSLELVASSMPDSVSLFFQGSARVMTSTGAGTPYSDGLLCAGGTIVRLGAKSNSANRARYPALGDPPISVVGAVPALGGRRVYQVWYRNAAPGFCTTGTSNLTNAVGLDWRP